MISNHALHRRYEMNNRTTTGDPANSVRGRDISTLKLINEKKVAEIYGLKVNTLRNWRSNKQGPKYLKINGKMIRYRVQDIEDYLVT